MVPFAEVRFIAQHRMARIDPLRPLTRRKYYGCFLRATAIRVAVSTAGFSAVQMSAQLMFP